MTRKLRQIQALLNPTAGFPEVYMKHVLIKHLTQSLAHHLTKPLTQPFMQPINTNLNQHLKQTLTQTQYLTQLAYLSMFAFNISHNL